MTAPCFRPTHPSWEGDDWWTAPVVYPSDHSQSLLLLLLLLLRRRRRRRPRLRLPLPVSSSRWGAKRGRLSQTRDRQSGGWDAKFEMRAVRLAAVPDRPIDPTDSKHKTKEGRCTQITGKSSLTRRCETRNSPPNYKLRRLIRRLIIRFSSRYCCRCCCCCCTVG